MSQVAGACIDGAAESIVAGRDQDRSLVAAAEVLLHGFQEIEHALQATELLEALVGSPAPRSATVSKHAYLKFLIGAYLQEVYILECRLTAYATKVRRVYTRVDEKAVSQMVREALGETVRLRGKHVHEKRQEDRRIDYLLGAASVAEVVPGLEAIVDAEYRKVRSEWRGQVKRGNAATRELLERYFAHLLAGVVKDGAVVLPRTGRGQPERKVNLTGFAAL